MAPGARRPMHPTRTFPTGTGGPGGPGFAPRPGFGGGPGRPGFGNRPGAAQGGLMPAPGEAPGPNRPVRAGSRGRGAPRYEKNKEVALKGYSVPRFGGPQIPQVDVPITKTITVTEGISVKDLAVMNMPESPVVVSLGDEFLKAARGVVFMARRATQRRMQNADIEHARHRIGVAGHEIVSDIALPEALPVQRDL